MGSNGHKEPQSGRQMKLVIVGHVDHGKSTLVGRLMADTDSLPTGKLDFIKDICDQQGKSFEFAFLLDALEEEQKQGITIDAARILGVDDRVGSLEVGKDGDLALYDGDPFEWTTHCVGVVIDGEVVDGPYTETKEVVGGFFIVQAPGWEVARDMARACPALEVGDIIELREVSELTGD